jgi:hypothetical protein
MHLWPTPLLRVLLVCTLMDVVKDWIASVVGIGGVELGMVSMKTNQWFMALMPSRIKT